MLFGFFVFGFFGVGGVLKIYVVNFLGGEGDGRYVYYSFFRFYERLGFRFC